MATFGFEGEKIKKIESVGYVVASGEYAKTLVSNFKSSGAGSRLGDTFVKYFDVGETTSGSLFGKVLVFEKP